MCIVYLIKIRIIIIRLGCDQNNYNGHSLKYNFLKGNAFFLIK